MLVPRVLTSSSTWPGMNITPGTTSVAADGRSSTAGIESPSAAGIEYSLRVSPPSWVSRLSHSSGLDVDVDEKSNS